MKLYLQYGHGMKEHCAHLLTANIGTGVILSPRDSNQQQLMDIASKARNAGGAVLLDPQCYARDADRPKLVQHPFWQACRDASTDSVLTGNGAAIVVGVIEATNVTLGSSAVVLPGLMAEAITDVWLTYHERLAAQAATTITGKPVFATIALSADVMADETQVEAVIEQASGWNVAGYYVVAQAPKYLVENVNWLANLLILTAGLKLVGREVVVGYGNHQMLCLASANVDAFAAGTWLNVRAFDPNRFYIQEEDEVSRRTKWYYCPQALSEYKITFLDAAKRAGILDDLRSHPSLGSNYADPLFAGPQPTSINWNERDAFRHYLTCLNGQVGQSRKATFDETIDHHRALLNTAEERLRYFRSKGVLAGNRGFDEILDVNRSALSLLTQARGTQLRHSW